MWFFNSGKMEMLEGFVPTSKVQLKRFCLTYSKGDVKKAMELYDYYSEGLDLPDVDPVPPTMMGQLKEGASSLFGFLKENQEDIMQAYSIIKGFVGNTHKADTALPPINVTQ